MSDISIRKVGRAGRITLTRPKALNALSYPMCLAIEKALDDWAHDDSVALIVVDAEGDRAFCAGGDIESLYRTGIDGDAGYSQRFWRDEYRMNAKMANFPKPVVALMQGFVMGGGVGLGGHTSHRIVGDTTQIAMPECGIGLIPDVGGTLVLARAPGRMGEYLGLTGARIGAGDAIYTGFADYYLPEAEWPALIDALEQSGDPSCVDRAAHPAPDAPLRAHQDEIDAHFAGATLGDVMRGWPAEPSEFMVKTRKVLERNSPLSMGCTLELVRRSRGGDRIEYALAQEYRFTYRAIEKSDLLEGVRAAIIDKDRTPTWMHKSWEELSNAQVTAMLMPLGDAELKLEETA